MKLPLILAAAFAVLPFFQTARAADGPTPFPDPKNEAAWPGKGPIRVFGWMVDNRNSFWSYREKAQGSVVFAGDSLTGNWKAATLAKEFPGLKIANRGIGGDVSRGLLFRFKEDVIDLNPRALVLCIGTNDLSSHGDPAAVEGNLKEILGQARAYSATMPIVISTTLPRDMAEAPMKPGAEADLKARTLKLGEGDKNIVVVDAFPAMSTPDGKPVPEYFAKDKLHLAEPGYVQWATVIRPALEKLGVK